MTENLAHIHIFRTNVNTDADKMRVGEVFSNHPGVKEWNVDIEDIDRVLRIVSPELCPAQIIQQINKIGYQCHELD